MEPDEDAELSMILKTRADRHAAPAALRARIGGAIRQADARTRRRPEPRGWRLWLNMGAAFAMGVVASVSASFFLAAENVQERLANEVVAGHVRSLMGAHLADVSSSDRHAVKPWFAGRLDFSPPVPDLAKEGFPLLGGRLDYLGGRPAAALIYKHRQHTINVFVLPRDERFPAPPAAFAAQGFNVTGWRGDAMQFWLASDLNAGELRQFAQRLRQATQEAGS